MDEEVDSSIEGRILKENFQRYNPGVMMPPPQQQIQQQQQKLVIPWRKIFAVFFYSSGIIACAIWAAINQPDYFILVLSIEWILTGILLGFE